MKNTVKILSVMLVTIAIFTTMVPASNVSACIIPFHHDHTNTYYVNTTITNNNTVDYYNTTFVNNTYVVQHWNNQTNEYVYYNNVTNDYAYWNNVTNELVYYNNESNQYAYWNNVTNFENRNIWNNITNNLNNYDNDTFWNNSTVEMRYYSNITNTPEWMTQQLFTGINDNIAKSQSELSNQINELKLQNDKLIKQANYNNVTLVHIDDGVKSAMTSLIILIIIILILVITVLIMVLKPKKKHE